MGVKRVQVSPEARPHVDPDAFRVLLVEDDPLFTKLLSTMLATQNWRVQACSSAEAALEIIASQDFRLIITDLKMDGLGGVGLIRSLIGTGAFPLNRILVMTGEPQGSEDSSWVAGQRIEILRKPFSIKTLLHAVDTVVDRSA